MSDLLQNPNSASSPPEETDPVALATRLMVLSEHMKLAAQKANLLIDMGLNQTEGFRTAYADYEAKLADYNRVRQLLGE
jgi:hypothetical protein